MSRSLVYQVSVGFFGPRISKLLLAAWEDLGLLNFVRRGIACLRRGQFFHGAQQAAHTSPDRDPAKAKPPCLVSTLAEAHGVRY